MLKPARNLVDAFEDDSNWARRSEHWQTKSTSMRHALQKFRYREPLILCGHGIRIRVDHGTLLIRNGFTHYPQNLEEFRFFPADSNLPDRIIILDGSGGISFDALNWISEQEIAFLQINWRGEVTQCRSPSGYCARPGLAERQRSAKLGKLGAEITAWLISEKLRGCISVLENHIPGSEIRNKAISTHKNRISEIEGNSKISISRILGMEGDCALHYFRAWQGIPLFWKNSKRKPVPESWFSTVPRTMTWRRGSNKAQHPVNAMLNYGYGVMINQIHTQVLAAGLDPKIGFVHGNKQNKIPLVYDLLEPLRPTVDRAVLSSVINQPLNGGDFTIGKDGACRLNPQFAKTFVARILETEKSKLVSDFVRRI